MTLVALVALASCAPPALPARAPSFVAGGMFVCGLRDKTGLRCLGLNNAGQLGDGTQTNRSSPVAAVGLARPVAVAAGAGHACALDAQGSVRCWGNNQSGQLGDGTTASRPQPGPVKDIAGATAIAAGALHTCALAAGRVSCWGDNIAGQLGDGSTANRPLPAPVAGVAGAVAIAAGQAHTCALLADATLTCWGWNENGQLGDGTTTNRPSPVPVPGLGDVVEVTSGVLASSTCAILRDRSARCWGWNVTGVLGDGTTRRRLTPTPVLDLAGVQRLSLGAEHACALLPEGKVACWGSNRQSEIQRRAVPAVTRPLAVSLPAPALAVVAGPSGGTLAVHDRTVSAWGGFWSRLQRGQDPPIETELFVLAPPPGFRRKDGEDLVYSHENGNHILEIFERSGPAPRTASGELALPKTVPRIGRITATTADGVEKRAGGDLYWFRQRSSVQHTPLVARGFVVVAPSSYALIRLVTNREDQSDAARKTLEEMLKNDWLRVRR